MALVATVSSQITAPGRAPFRRPGGVDGVLLVGHGSVRRPEAAAVLARHAAALAKPGGRLVGHAVFNGGPDPLAVARALGPVRRLQVLPMFMADGYMTRELLPARLAAALPKTPLHFCPPLGLAPELADLAARAATENLPEPVAKDAPVGVRPLVVLAAHGSRRSPASRHATERLAGLMAANRMAVSSGVQLRTAYLEEAPYVADVLAGLDRPATVISLFAGGGAHAALDMPQALADAAQPVTYAGALGEDPRIVQVIEAALARAEADLAAA